MFEEFEKGGFGGVGADGFDGGEGGFADGVGGGTIAHGGDEHRQGWLVLELAEGGGEGGADVGVFFGGETLAHRG